MSVCVCICALFDCVCVIEDVCLRVLCFLFVYLFCKFS